jgi:aspartate ammonia-lyase
MPGKVNPVVPEAINQIAFRVFGADTTVTFAAEGGQLQLNAFEPVIMWSIHEAVTLLVGGIDTLVTRCIDGISANEVACRDHLMGSTALATALVPLVGYDRAAAVAKLALADDTSLAAAVRRLEPDSAAAFEHLSVDRGSEAESFAG